MDPSSLALRFNEVSTALRPLGHRVIVRRARELLGEGRFDDSVIFLSESARRLSVRELAGLANDVRSWIHARGNIDDLMEEQSWIVGSEIDDLVSAAINDEYERHGAQGIRSMEVNRELHATQPVPPSVTDLISPPRMPDEETPIVRVVESSEPLEAQEPTILVPEVLKRAPQSPLPTGPLVAGIIMLLV